MDLMSIAFAVLLQEEGLKLKPYLCSEGYVTIGVGTKLHCAKGMNCEEFPLEITEEVAFALATHDIGKSIKSLENSKYGAIYQKQDDNRKAILVSMVYQMGITGVLRFKKMWGALDKDNYPLAAEEMLDSLWSTQTPNRAMRHSEVVRTGDMSYYGASR